MSWVSPGFWSVLGWARLPGWPVSWLGWARMGFSVAMGWDPGIGCCSGFLERDWLGSWAGLGFWSGLIY
jgi:hypothetical protein